ncbi:GTP 3',8-cyclase MoaA [Candidatus Sororendozoicomonas aggregata]|uniref:GTP 3',8-cyclase MoaA n=1 Tax=Candidatus Sororendozoicomonas aggregata TaxID=3073239 RepID=UPI002ED61E1B
MSSLKDTLGRTFPYLRLSVTDLCNFRCNYCLPDGCLEHNHKAALKLVEIKRLIHAFSQLGVEKIRITGGEPTLRHDFTDIVQTIKAAPGIHTVAMTTNGYKMDQCISAWLKAGIDAVNVSVDSLNPGAFSLITGHNRLQEILAGIKAGFELGLPVIKVNTVLMKGLNDGELSRFLAWIKDQPITLRLIELMETGDNHDFFNRHHVSGSTIRSQLIDLGWVRIARSRDAGPAQEYRHSDYQGRIGLITPYARDFCDDCNRLRVTSLGKLQLCLFGDQGIDLRDLLQHDHQQDALIERITSSLRLKKDSHFLDQGITGNTANLAQLGG